MRQWLWPVSERNIVRKLLQNSWTGFCMKRLDAVLFQKQARSFVLLISATSRRKLVISSAGLVTWQVDTKVQIKNTIQRIANLDQKWKSQHLSNEILARYFHFTMPNLLSLCICFLLYYSTLSSPQQQIYPASVFHETANSICTIIISFPEVYSNPLLWFFVSKGRIMESIFQVFN